MALEAPLLTRMRLIKVGIESPKGTPFDCVQGLQVLEPGINWESDYQSRSDVGSYRGNSVAGVQVGLHGVSPFMTELRSNGAGGLEAGLAILLQAGGLKKTADVYQVHSGPADDKTISIEYWQSGDMKALAGAASNVIFGGNTGERMMCKFSFDGNWQAPITQTHAAFITSMVAPLTTAPMIIQSGTFTFATESIKIASFELDMGNIVIPRRDVAGEGGTGYYMISWTKPVLKLKMEADTVAGFDYYGRQLAATPGAVSLVLNDGTDKVTFTMPAVVSMGLKEADDKDVLFFDGEFECLHSAGNDSVKIEADTLV